MKLVKENIIKKGLIWPVIYIIFIITSGQLLLHFRIMTGRTFNPYPQYLTILLMPLIFGVLLRLPGLIERWNSNHKFNWSKFIYQGIPALILVFLSHPLFSLLFGRIFPFAVVRQLFIYDTKIIFLAAVWLGVVVTDAIKGSLKT